MTYVDPPNGWYPFGTHALWGESPRLEFSEEVGEDLLPLFERPSGVHYCGVREVEVRFDNGRWGLVCPECDTVLGYMGLAPDLEAEFTEREHYVAQLERELENASATSRANAAAHMEVSRRLRRIQEMIGEPT